MVNTIINIIIGRTIIKLKPSGQVAQQCNVNVIAIEFSVKEQKGVKMNSQGPGDDMRAAICKMNS